MEQQNYNEYLLKVKSSLFQDVAQFNKEIIGTEKQGYISCLSDERLNFAVKVLTEEIDEFIQAHVNKDQVAAIDAMIDLIYYSFGRLYELGLSAENFIHAWEKVHEANMKKEKGDKGRGTDQDAVKPAGWTEPKIDFYNNLTKEQLKYMDQLLKIPRDVAKQLICSSEQETIFNMIGYVKESSITKLSDIPEPFIECALLRKKKGEDYRNNNIEMKDYFPFGLLSYTQMLHTKILRLRSLVGESKEPKNESIRDTLLDMMNYACFAIEAIDRKEI